MVWWIAAAVVHNNRDEKGSSLSSFTTRKNTPNTQLTVTIRKINHTNGVFSKFTFGRGRAGGEKREVQIKDVKTQRGIMRKFSKWKFIIIPRTRWSFTIATASPSAKRFFYDFHEEGSGFSFSFEIQVLKATILRSNSKCVAHLKDQTPPPQKVFLRP